MVKGFNILRVGHNTCVFEIRATLTSNRIAAQCSSQTCCCVRAAAVPLCKVPEMTMSWWYTENPRFTSCVICFLTRKDLRPQTCCRICRCHLCQVQCVVQDRIPSNYVSMRCMLRSSCSTPKRDGCNRAIPEVTECPFKIDRDSTETATVGGQQNGLIKGPSHYKGLILDPRRPTREYGEHVVPLWLAWPNNSHHRVPSH